MEDTLIKLADLYYLCNDDLKRNSHTIHCLFTVTDFINGRFTGDPNNYTTGGHYFKMLVKDLHTRTNNKLIKKYPFRFKDLFQVMDSFIELYKLRKSEFEVIDYEALRANYPNFDHLFLCNYYDLVYSNTISIFNNFNNAGLKIKFDSDLKSIPQLTTKLTTDQINLLFQLLVKGKFIPETTDKDCFNWAFNNLNEKQPEPWQPITWNEAKQGSRELLTPILGTITNQHKRDIEQLFLKDGKPFKMSKPKKNEHSARCTDIEKIINSLNLENIPTNTDQYRPHVNQ